MDKQKNHFFQFINDKDMKMQKAISSKMLIAVRNNSLLS